MERTTMWENIGVKASTNDFDTLMKEADLDYVAVSKDMYAGAPNENPILVPDRKIIVREDTNQVFGIVSDRYQICQNKDALDFVKYIDDINLIKAGQIGATVYMIAQLPEVKILDDSIKPHLIFQNSHDGSSSIKTTICMLRMVCQNQFVTSFKESPATIKISHLGNLDEKLVVARETLSSVNSYVRNFEDTAGELARTKITPVEFNKIVEKFFSTSEEFSDRKNKRIEEERDQFLQALNADDNANFVKTKWGMVNAFADFTTHYEPTRKSEGWQENRFLWYLNPSVMDNFIEFVKAA